MALVIQTNIASLQAQRNLNESQLALSSSFNKLSSGMRINSASDDAAGLAISESMTAKIRSYTVAERNANDGVSMAQTAEGALGEITSILHRMRELAMQGSNGAVTTTDRSYMQTEFAQLKSEVTRIQSSTKFNSKSLIATAAATFQFQVGVSTTSNDRITVAFGGLNLSSLGAASVSGGTTTASLRALTQIDNTLKTISTNRARYGAAINRLNSATSNIQTMRLNLQSANSRIRDVDVAEETAAMSRNQVLSQAGAAVLAQANQLPQTAMGLLKG